MKNRTSLLTATAVMLLLGNSSFAQQFEAVHAVQYESPDQAETSIAALMQDDSMKDARVSLYAQTFGDYGSSHLVVEDFDSYEQYMSTTEDRLASHAWSRYLLQTMSSDYRGSNLAIVVDDHGAPRHTAGYLAAFLIHTTDAATYRSAMADLNKAIGNPGVLRLVAMRTGTRDHTHAVLIGAGDFKALNEYLDKLLASDAFADFLKKVGETREVVAVNMYRRVGTWGD